MKLVHVGNAKGRQHDEQDQMTQNEVGSEVTQFSDLTEEFTTGLRNGMPTHAVPFTGPPGNVGLVVLEFTSQGQRNNKLVDEPLNGCHGYHAENTTGPRPSL